MARASVSFCSFYNTFWRSYVVIFVQLSFVRSSVVVLSTKLTLEEAEKARRLADLFFQKGYLHASNVSQLLRRLLKGTYDMYRAELEDCRYWDYCLGEYKGVHTLKPFTEPNQPRTSVDDKFEWLIQSGNFYCSPGASWIIKTAEFHGFFPDPMTINRKIGHKCASIILHGQ